LVGLVLKLSDLPWAWASRKGKKKKEKKKTFLLPDLGYSNADKASRRKFGGGILGQVFAHRVICTAAYQSLYNH
jgi:hypothetical protein